MDWESIFNRVLNCCINQVEYAVWVQLAILLVSMTMVVLLIGKDKKSRWLGVSLAVMIAQLFMSMHVYCNLFNIVFRRKEIYEYWLINATMDETKRESAYLVWVVLALDVAFIVFFCIHFIRNYHMGIIHMIVALAAGIGTRITGYFSTITPPTFAFNVFQQRHGDAGMLSIVVPAKQDSFTQRLSVLNSAPKIIGIIAVVALFASLITLSLQTKKYYPKRKMLFVFPSLILIIELIRYMTISMCELFFERLADLKFGAISIITCILCLAWAVYLFRTRGKEPEQDIR